MNEWEWRLLEERPTLGSVHINGVEVREGSRVLLRPGRGGDAQDVLLAGKTAAIESIEQDYEGGIHLALVLDDDPGRDLGLLRQPGHRFFFSPHEVEPILDRPTILVAGIGNIFLGDDGFGVEVIRRLANRPLPAGVRVEDFGIRGLDLAYALLDGADVTILIDACPRGDRPGTLYVIEPDLTNLDEASGPALIEPHAMNPVNVIRAARGMGGELKRILLLGCEPDTLGPPEGQLGLSASVEAAVDGAVDLLHRLVGDLRRQA